MLQFKGCVFYQRLQTKTVTHDPTTHRAMRPRFFGGALRELQQLWLAPFQPSFARLVLFVIALVIAVVYLFVSVRETLKRADGHSPAGVYLRREGQVYAKATDEYRRAGDNVNGCCVGASAATAGCSGLDAVAVAQLEPGRS